MSSGPRRDSNKTTFSSGTPHFFKIILEETLQENKLRIPQKFIIKYGETLSNSVFVKLPCGSKWNMKLTKKDDNIWLEKGWPDFARHYAIKRGSMLIFRYEGNSEFHAVIFDSSTVEIDYPSIPVHFDESYIDLELQAPREEVVEDDCVEIFDDLSPCPESPLPYSLPHKRMRMSPNECVLKNSMSKGNLQSSKQEMIGNKSLTSRQKINQNINLSGQAINDEIGEPNSLDNFPSIQASGCMSIPWKKSQGRLATNKKARILERVPFESEKPFFKVLMQPSYVGTKADHLHLPVDFSEIHIKNEDDIILSIPNGKSWSAEIKKFFQTTGKFTAAICKGWNEFAADNDLEVGDVCIFELVNGTKILFQVSIIRFADGLRHQGSQGISDFPAKSDRDKSITRRQKIYQNINLSSGAINDEVGEPSSLYSFPPKQASKCMSRPWKTSRLRLATNKKSRILARFPFESEKPFFKVLMQRAYVGSRARHLHVPIDFSERHIKNEGDIVLSIPNGRSWSTRIRRSCQITGKLAAVICDGWKEFAVDNYLEVGDVCIFELLNGTKFSFQVSIIRFADNLKRQGSQASDFAKGGDKPKEDEIVKLEID